MMVNHIGEELLLHLTPFCIKVVVGLAGCTTSRRVGCIKGFFLSEFERLGRNSQIFSILGSNFFRNKIPITILGGIARSKSHGFNHTIVLQAIVHRNEEGEVRLHGQEVCAVEFAERSIPEVSSYIGVVSMDYGVHHLSIPVIKCRSHDGAESSRSHHALHHINHTIVGNHHLTELALVIGNSRISVHTEHLVLGIVHDGEILAGYRLVKGFLHQVGHQGLHHVERYLIQVKRKVFNRIRSGAISFNQHLTATIEKVFLHGGIRRHEHGSHVLFLGRAVGRISVPSRIIGQRGEVAQCFAFRILCDGTPGRTLRDVKLLVNRVCHRGMQSVILLRQRSVIIRRAKAIEHLAEEVCLTVGTNQFCHVRRRNHHLVQHMEISVKTNIVGFGDTAVISVTAVFRIRILPFVIPGQIHDKRYVLMRNFLLVQLSFEEVGEHGLRFIHCHIEAQSIGMVVAQNIPEFFIHICGVTLFIQLSFIEVVGQFVTIEESNRVGRRDTRQLTQTQVLHRSLNGGEHFEHIGIVKHGAIQEQTLLVR